MIILIHSPIFLGSVWFQEVLLQLYKKIRHSFSMKILQLELTAFGSFTDKILDFSVGNHGIHVMYGPNEAGKSTLRRAITHLLFGIPERTMDAYLHTTDQLRIGVHLLNNKGEELICYRRKGRKNTLLGSDQKPLEESCLQAFFGNMNEARFTALFCFDHEHLRQGGEDLLHGGGDVGESLFEAGTGSLRVHEVLAQLDKEADELFKARGVKPRLNQTIRLYKDSAQRIKDQSLSAHKWQEQAKALEEARERHVQLTQQLQKQRAEQHRLERIQRTLPLLQRRQILQTELAQLEPVIVLPDDAATQHFEMKLALRNARHQEEQAKQDIHKITQQLNEVVLPHLLLAHKSAIDDLRGRLGSHQKAARDLPGVRTEMRTIENEAQNLLQRVYPQLTLKEVIPHLCITHPQRARIKELAEQVPTLLEQERSILKRLAELDEQLVQQRHRLASLALPPDLTELKAALHRALKQGDLENDLAKDEKDLHLLTTKAQMTLKQIGLWSHQLEELEQVALPGPERIETFDRRFKDIEHDRQRIKERLLEARQQHQRVTQKINALQWMGEVPTEASLAETRRIRQQYWQTIKQAPQLPFAKGGIQDTYRAFEEEMFHADELADRLRREAQRIAEYGMLLSEQQNAQKEQEQQTKKWRLTEELLATLQLEWEECWKPLGIQPWSPTEMRSWLSESIALRQQVSGLRERRQILEVKQQLMRELCNELKKALAKFSHLVPLTRLTDLIEQGQNYVNEVNLLQKNREYLEKEIGDLSIELDRTQSTQKHIQETLTQWRIQWEQAIAPLQLVKDTPHEVARNVLDTLDQIFNKLDKVNGLRRRVELMDRDANHFREEVATLVQKIMPELAHEEAEQVVPILANRLTQAEKNAARFEQLQQHLDTHQQRQSSAHEQVQNFETRLQALLEQAHCDNLAELEIAERASAHKKGKEQEFTKIEQQLLELGEGMSLEELIEATKTVEIDHLPGEIQNYTEHIQQIEQERSEVDRTIGELGILLKQMDGNAKAAQAADEAQWALADIHTLSERYMQLHLAASVLRKAIERYREQNQGPLIRRASELFRQLTVNKFSGLKSDYQGNDQPILLGQRTPDSAGIATIAMSDGTRDQLYLALRLASIERYIERNMPVPLILDDILINFDDERSQATLEVLGELCQKTQILFFTHHLRLVELAQAILPKENLVMHRL